jgi:hypothetical protein
MMLRKITGLRGQTIAVIPDNRYYRGKYGGVEYGWETFNFC